MQRVPNLTLRALGRAEVERLRGYAWALRLACSAHPPPYGMEWYGETFRERAGDPQWMAESLVVNAQKEAEGAAVIWELAGVVADQAVRRLIQRHAVDESRHARIYVVMLETVFPTALSREAAQALRRQFPSFSPADLPPPVGRRLSEREITDAVIQMNIGEIRTRINQLLFMPVMTAYCRPERRARLSRMLEAILADETSHVRYTARLIERASLAGLHDFVSAMMTERMEDINRLTLREVNGPAFAVV